MSYRDQVNLWREKVKRYQTPFYAKTNTLLKQQTIDHSAYGPWMSMAFERGVRTYVFTTQADRDRFVNQYRATYEARPCGDPLK